VGTQRKVNHILEERNAGRMETIPQALSSSRSFARLKAWLGIPCELDTFRRGRSAHHKSIGAPAQVAAPIPPTLKNHGKHHNLPPACAHRGAFTAPRHDVPVVRDDGKVPSSRAKNPAGTFDTPPLGFRDARSVTTRDPPMAHSFGAVFGTQHPRCNGNQTSALIGADTDPLILHGRRKEEFDINLDGQPCARLRTTRCRTGRTHPNEFC